MKQRRSATEKDALPTRGKPVSRKRNVAKVTATGEGPPAARSVAERKKLEFYLGHLAQYDVLTELPNRSQFRDRLGGAIARAMRHQQMAGVMLVNLDSFKAVNTRHGHHNGDRVLQEVAGRLKQCT